jgi:hypothetical protein
MPLAFASGPSGDGLRRSRLFRPSFRRCEPPPCRRDVSALTFDAKPDVVAGETVAVTGMVCV